MLVIRERIYAHPVLHAHVQRRLFCW